MPVSSDRQVWRKEALGWRSNTNIVPPLQLRLWSVVTFVESKGYEAWNCRSTSLKQYPRQCLNIVDHVMYVKKTWTGGSVLKVFLQITAFHAMSTLSQLHNELYFKARLQSPVVTNWEQNKVFIEVQICLTRIQASIYSLVTSQIRQNEQLLLSLLLRLLLLS